MILLPSFVNDMINIIIFTYLKNTAKVYDICAPNQQTVKMSERKYDRHTTAMEVVEGMDLGGKTILITGANNGIGLFFVIAIVIITSDLFSEYCLFRFRDCPCIGYS